MRSSYSFFKIVSVCLTTAALLPTVIFGVVETRAAIDVGSGMTKLAVADVDTEAHVIVRNLYSEAVLVPLKQLDGDGNIPESTAEELLYVLDCMTNKARAYGATSFAAVGTEALRKAGNGQRVLDRIHDTVGLEVLMLPQQDEAMIGYLSAVASLTDAAQRTESMVVLDAGWGSMQFSTLVDGRFVADGSPIGFSVVEGLWKLLLQGRTEFYPFNRGDVDHVIDHLDGLFGCVDFKGTHTVYYGLSTIELASRLLGLDPERPLSLEQVKQALAILGTLDPAHRHSLLDRYSDQNFPVIALMTLAAVMEYNEIEYVQYFDSLPGITGGVLIHPQLWQRHHHPAT